MNPIGSNSVASKVYSGVQRGNTNPADPARISAVAAQQPNPEQSAAASTFGLPKNATPRGDWVLSENANPQNFEAGAPRGSYLNVVV